MQLLSDSSSCVADFVASYSGGPPDFVGWIAERQDETTLRFMTFDRHPTIQKSQDGPDACVWLTESQEVIELEFLLPSTPDERQTSCCVATQTHASGPACLILKFKVE